MSENEVLDIRQAVNDDAIVQSSKKTTTSNIKSFFDRYKWWIIGAIAVVAVIVIIIIIICTRKPAETFVSFNTSDAKHRKIDTTPVTTYLESYISSALGYESGAVNPYIDQQKK